MDKRIRFVSLAGMIAALYVVLTFIASMMGLASGVIQIRLSEVLNVLVCFTGAAVPGMFIGCISANLLTGGCVLDLIFGSLATLIGAFLGRLISKISHGKFNMLVPVPTVLSNALIVPWVLQKGYGINLPYTYLMMTVGVGELLSAGLLGLFLYYALWGMPVFRRMTE